MCQLGNPSEYHPNTGLDIFPAFGSPEGSAARQSLPLRRPFKNLAEVKAVDRIFNRHWENRGTTK
jgi:hypothetical protein